MPNRYKRKIEDFDPNKSDSADSTYGASTTRAGRSKPSRSHRGKPSRKRQRRLHSDEGSEDISDESEVSDVSFEEEVKEEEPELDARTGRPVRKAAKQRPLYEEDSDESIDEAPDSEPVDEAASKKSMKRSLLVKLKVPTPQQTPAPAKRNTRARSGSVGVRRISSDMQPSATRRSSRIAHDESETIVALTNSGHHADIIRAGTRSPELEIQRARKGGKGLKKLPASVVYEGDEDSGPKEHTGDDDQQTTEVAASREDLTDELQASNPLPDTQNMMQGDPEVSQDAPTDEVAIIPESAEDEPLDEDDEDPITKPRRTTRHSERKHADEGAQEAPGGSGGRPTRHALRSAREARKLRSSQKSGRQESSDFEPVGDEEGEGDISDSEVSESSPQKGSQQVEEDSSTRGRRGTRAGKGRSRSQRNLPSEDSEVAEELAEELEDLRGSRPRRARRDDILFDDKPKTRTRKPVDYRILRPDLALPLEDDGPPAATTPSRKGRGGAGGGWQRSLFSTYGPFGGAGGPTPVFGGPGGLGAAAGADSDSSDDDIAQRPRAGGVGGTLGMTPTAAAAPVGFGLFPAAQAHSSDPVQGPSGTPANLGKIKDKHALADADPLGIDQNVNFDSVGGLQGHIDQLKEMVALPLLYPEVFQRFHVTPPRGVLFHGPPGTGKTLLARALASSVSTQGRKVTFYMRKGADALSKWVGEAERQLRLLFDEARKNQPSIIFFDEIDGLAPVRSSKQEQIHASIVSTLLALMDGMDGRGQVIVIGATNRPDSIDPALRRPGRFDREFYFPLPNTEARRAILDIHTKGWQPPLANSFKDEIAHLTKGYGGADLRALCTEAALNAVQRRYPQIYKSNEKLQIKPETINITAKDFMISVKNMVPSSERSASSGAAPLPTHIEPLLRQPLAEIKNVVAQALPQKKRLTALEEAEFEDAEGDRGMKTERMQQEFERSRIFRPRLLIRGIPGMGQQYLAAALLNHFEGLHVQAFDLPALLSDSGRSPEAAVIQLFTEVRRHKPSVIYIPNVDIWYRTIGDAVISTFLGLLRTLAPTDPVLMLGILEAEDQYVDPQMIKDLFGFSRKNQFEIRRPGRSLRREYFSAVMEYLNTSPADFPEPANRKKRKLEILPPVPPEPQKDLQVLSAAELKAQRKKDRQLLNFLKLRIQPIMDQIRLRYKKFRTGVIDESQIRYLYDEEDPSMVNTDLPLEERRNDHFRPYEKGTDGRGEPGLVEVATGKFYYNLEIVTIEKRLSNGYYKRPKDFLSDIKKLTKDAKTVGDQERLLKANELQANVEVDMGGIEIQEPGLMADLDGVYARETKREREMIEKAKQLAASEGRRLELIPTNVPPDDGGLTTEQSTGPIVLGQPMINGVAHHPVTPSNPSNPSLPSTLTNGLSVGISDLSDLQGQAPQSNGTSVPSHGDGDTHMTNNSQDPPSTERETQGSSFGPSAQTRPLHSYTGGPASLQQRLSLPGSLSQKSAITPMAEGSNPHDYANYASTTSSDKRNTGSSGPFNTQSSHGKVVDGPDLSAVPDPLGAPSSQLPDTQAGSQKSDPSSQGLPTTPSQPFSNSNPPTQPFTQPISHSQPSQPLSNSSQPNSQSQSQSQPTPTVPPFPRPQNIHSLLNDPAPRKDLQRQKLTTDHPGAAHLLNDVVSRTSGCSVEQLEQVYSAMMDVIWRTRGEWERGRVVRSVREAVEEVVEDMRGWQGGWAGSLEIADGGGE